MKLSRPPQLAASFIINPYRFALPNDPKYHSWPLLRGALNTNRGQGPLRVWRCAPLM